MNPLAADTLCISSGDGIRTGRIEMPAIADYTDHHGPGYETNIDRIGRPYSVWGDYNYLSSI
jgi:hypothetical protein